MVFCFALSPEVNSECSKKAVEWSTKLETNPNTKWRSICYVVDLVDELKHCEHEKKSKCEEIMDTVALFFN